MGCRGPTSVTLDYYHIEIDDRLALLTDTVDQAAVDDLIAAGIPNAALLLGSNANFFVNGFDSEIEGIDFAVTSGFDLGGGDLVVDFRHNYNKQEVSNVAPGTINAARVYDLENQIPENRSVLSFNWASGGMFGALLRLNYYDSWSTTGGLFNDPGDPPDRVRLWLDAAGRRRGQLAHQRHVHGLARRRKPLRRVPGRRTGRNPAIPRRRGTR